MFGNDGFEEPTGGSTSQASAGDIHRPLSFNDNRAFDMLEMMQRPTEMMQWCNIDKRSREKRMGNHITQVIFFVVFFAFLPFFVSLLI